MYTEDLMFIFSGTVELGWLSPGRCAWLGMQLAICSTVRDRACSVIFTDDTGTQFGILAHYGVIDNFQGGVTMRD